jgi:hypothetical protein
MHQPMTPIELIASAFTILATGALIWWGLNNLISMAAQLYEKCRPMREEAQEETK